MPSNFDMIPRASGEGAPPPNQAGTARPEVPSRAPSREFDAGFGHQPIAPPEPEPAPDSEAAKALPAFFALLDDQAVEAPKSDEIASFTPPAYAPAPAPQATAEAERPYVVEPYSHHYEAPVQDEPIRREEPTNVDDADMTYRTSHSPEAYPAGYNYQQQGEYHTEGVDPDHSASEDDYDPLRAQPDDSLAPRRLLDEGDENWLRKLAPFGIVAVFGIIGLTIAWLALSPIFKAVFGGHHAMRTAMVDVSATNQTRFGAAGGFAGNASSPMTPAPSLPGPTEQYRPAPSPTMPLPVTERPAVALSEPQPTPEGELPVAAPPPSGDRQVVPNPLTAEIASLKTQIATLNASLDNQQTTIAAQNAKLASVESNAQLTSDKNSAAIALLENNIVTLQTALNNLQSAAKPAETAALPVPSNDVSDSDSNQVIPGFDLRGASATAAVVKTPTGLFTYQMGQEIPGAGTTTGWKRWHGSWELITTDGVIRPAVTGN